jgi:hypothetical protein
MSFNFDLNDAEPQDETIPAGIYQVNTPPPKGGGFELRLKAGSVRHSADLGHVEVVIRLWWLLVLDVLNPYFVGHVSAARNPVAPAPEVLAPIPFAQDPEFAQQFVRTAPLQILHGARHRQTGRDGQQHMHVVAIDRSGVNDHLMRGCRLTQQFPAPHPDISPEDWVAILRHPHQVVLAVPNSVAAPLVRFHPAILAWNRRDPSRLKAWGFLIPYRGL